LDASPESVGENRERETMRCAAKNVEDMVSKRAHAPYVFEQGHKPEVM
jgi:hypothetical protein